MNEYPVLKESVYMEGYRVLFTSPRTGTVVTPPKSGVWADKIEPGMHSTHWAEEYFREVKQGDQK